MIRSTKKLSVEYFTEFMDAFGYAEEAKEQLTASLKSLIACDDTRVGIDEILEEYRDESFNYNDALKRARNLFPKADVGDYPGCFIFIAHLASTLRELYKEKGIPDSIWFDSMCDLKYKAKECILVKKHWGTFVSSWYSVFFNMSTFALGRLQFQKRLFDAEFTLDGVELKPDTPALYVHIPRTETPLAPDEVHKSYAMAKEFFKDSYFKGAPCVICCSSWLLFPEHENILKPESNIRRFMSDFTRVRSGETADYTFTWRLFDTEYNGNPDELPADSSLRRAYIERMKQGLPLGSALGVFIM